MRLELTRPNGHYPLKVARLPIPPPRQTFVFSWSEKRDSNPRPRPWQGRALPTELFSRLSVDLFRPSTGCFPDCVAKVGTFLELTKFWSKKMRFLPHFFSAPSAANSSPSAPAKVIALLYTKLARVYTTIPTRVEIP